MDRLQAMRIYARVAELGSFTRAAADLDMSRAAVSESVAALDPIRATAMGVAGHDDRLTDYSPSGIDARAELDRDTAVALAALEPGDDRERVAAAFLQERLATALGLADAGERQDVPVAEAAHRVAAIVGR